ncbi:MAG: hypothetical protein AAF720_02405 [Pseudomonadota bacterium]
MITKASRVFLQFKIAANLEKVKEVFWLLMTKLLIAERMTLNAMTLSSSMAKMLSSNGSFCKCAHGGMIAKIHKISDHPTLCQENLYLEGSDKITTRLRRRITK